MTGPAAWPGNMACTGKRHRILSMLLSGSEFLAAFPDLVPVLYIVMLVAWLNGYTILIARHHALHARRLLSKAQATSNPLL